MNSCTARLLLCLTLAASAHAEDWPQFRGPDASSSTDREDLPVEWSVETGQNIAWAADLPGNGLSSPIVVGDRVFVTAASGADNDRLHVLAFDRATGERLWQRQFWATGRTQCFRTSSVAAGTPASDGRRVFALFSSNDLVALDLEGNLLWMRSLTQEHPGLGNDIGMASSPIVMGDRVIVQCECQTAAFAAAYDAQGGVTRWEVERPKDSNWASPLAVVDSGADRTQPCVFLQDRSGLALLSTASGETLWRESAEGATMSSATAAGGLILTATNGLTAFRRTAESIEPVWQQTGVRGGAASPVVAGGKVFTFARGGILNAVDQQTGDKAFKKRLGGTFWATPLATPTRLYCPNQNGTVYVIASEDGKVIAENKMGGSLYGSPATADGAIYLRNNKKLWKITALRTASRPPKAAATAAKISTAYMER